MNGRLARRIWDYVSLAKPGIILLLIVTGFTGWWLASGSHRHWGNLVVMLVGLALSSGSANALNCYIDRDIDQIMKRTEERPLPAGRLKPSQALAFGVGIGIASLVILLHWTNVVTASAALFGILFYVFIYTLWLKRSSVHNTVVGGVAGALPPLIGWAAATGQITIPSILLFAIIFLWQPAHFWALAMFRHDDYKRANIPMLPVVKGPRYTATLVVIYCVLTVAASLLVAHFAHLNWIYLAVAAAAGAIWMGFSIRLWFKLSPKASTQAFAVSILYLFVLFGGMVAGGMT